MSKYGNCECGGRLKLREFQLHLPLLICADCRKRSEYKIAATPTPSKGSGVIAGPVYFRNFKWKIGVRRTGAQ